jgi:hypothetical protein
MFNDTALGVEVLIRRANILKKRGARWRVEGGDVVWRGGR